MDYVDFGQTGLRVSRLSMGTGTHGWGKKSDQTALGLDGLTDFLRSGYDHGINFWDSADQYGSHSHVARALQCIDRESVVITTKTTSRTDEEVTQDVERFLKELNTDVLDIVLLHCLTKADWPKRYPGAMEALSRAKEQGKLQAVGVSCHDFGAFCTAAESDWVEVVLARINYAGVSMDANPSDVVPVIRKMHESGKAVYGMKVLGCGKLTKNPEKAIDYVFSLGTVQAITIGMTEREQLSQNVRWVEEMSARYPIEGGTSG